ncbi:hypothetical protein CJ030_MR7G016923 [Morella rubra]|uniref:Uncharacterized protein n=1 Tax=Morella rubra TaxID=262757 RepID=A0A6A1UZY1_9ROSI|nr:hypothetical protein CJ030_MR7G016923 [Morella rubra]
MEYLRGRPVAKKHPVTLSDFDQLLYEEHSLYQLFEYQGFLHQLSWTEGFCVDTLVQDFFCALVSVDRAPEFHIQWGVVIGEGETRKNVKSALNKFTLSMRKGQEGALTRRFAHRATKAAEEAGRASQDTRPTRLEAPIEMRAPAVPPPWVAQLFADLDSRVGATVKTALQPLQE